MSTGGLLGGIGGGIVGFFIGGPVGALWGASIGFGVGMALDPIQPDTPAPGQMGMEVQVTTAKYGDPIPDILGTIKLTGNIIWYCCDNAVEETAEAEGGKGGGPSQTAVTGYKYYLSWAMALCIGPVDTIYTIYKDDDPIWAGELDCPVSGGQRSIYIEALETTIVFFYGTDDQEPLTALCRNLKAGNIGGGAGNPVEAGTCDDDANLNVPYRGICWVYVPNAYIGGYNRAPTLKFVVKKRPTITDGDAHDLLYANIGAFDYNPAHAVWYIQETLAGLPKSFMNSDSFEAVAETLHTEQRGLSIMFAQRQSALTYIESVNAHADMIERFDIDGSLHLKLIRADEDADDLPAINPNMLIEDPVINRPSWLGATNEVKVVFSERFAYCSDAEAFELDPTSDDEIAPNDTATLKVEGGCPPFGWKILTEDSGCTLAEADTYDRENTLSSGDCVTTPILVRATDAAGSTVGFVLTGLPNFAFDDDNTPDSVNADSCIDLYVTGGGAPFDWEIISSGDDEYTLTNSQTDVRQNELCAGCCIDTQVTIRVTDACGGTVQFTITGIPSATFEFDDDSTPDTIDPGDSIGVYVTGGCPPYTWQTTSLGYSLNQAETQGVVNTLQCCCPGGTCGVDFDPYAMVTVVDACGNSITFYIRNTAGQWIIYGILNVTMSSCNLIDSYCVSGAQEIIVDNKKWSGAVWGRYAEQGCGSPCPCPKCTTNWVPSPTDTPLPPCGSPYGCACYMASGVCFSCEANDNTQYVCISGPLSLSYWTC